MNITNWKSVILIISIIAAVGLAVILLLNPMNATSDTKEILGIVLGFLGGVISAGSHAIFAENPTTKVTP